MQVSAASSSGSLAALSYSQFLADVSAHFVDTVDHDPSAGGMSSGTLASGTRFTVVIPLQTGQSLLDVLDSKGVRVAGACGVPELGHQS